MVETVVMSREEFYRQAEIGENCLVDWEDGVAIRMAPAHLRHGKFIAYLMVRLDDWLKARSAGRAYSEVFVDFAVRTFGVDVVVLLNERLGQRRKGRIQAPPDVAPSAAPAVKRRKR